MLSQMNHAQMAVQKQISELRRKAGSTSPLTFAKAYLPSHLRLKPSRMHCDLFEMLQEVSHQRGARLAIAAPHYACGGYIRHGRSVCTVGAVHKDQLEEAVVGAAVQFYQPYTTAEKGEALIKTAIRKQLGSQQEQAAEQRVECEAEIERIDGLVRNLLDHIKVSNRDIVNQRLDELSRERDGLESQLTSLNQAVLEDDEIQELVQETIIFASSLDSTLHHGSPDQRRTALRRCVDGVVIDHPNKRAEMKLRVLPIGLDSHTTAITNPVVVEIAKTPSPNGRGTRQSCDK